MTETTTPGNRYLSRDHATTDDIYRQWDQGNDQWWNWYMSLADNPDDPAPATDGPREIIDPPAPDRIPSQQEFVAALREPHPVDPEEIDRFRAEGFVKLRDVLDPGTLHVLRVELKRIFREARLNDPAVSFTSLEMMWPDSPIMREFFLSPRLAQIAAELLGVPGVRLYHDNALCKEPGCGRTPWHYDATHFPIATEDIVTLWAPLQAIPRAMGPLEFARGADTYKIVQAIPFNKFDTSYDRQIADAFRANQVPVEDGPFDLGEVSFHHSNSCHAAGPNRTSTQRMVLATTYFADGARVVDRPTMISGDWQKFMPGVGPGRVIDSPLNPVCYPAPTSGINGGTVR